MKSLFASLLFLLGFSALRAQIVLHESDMATVGDRFVMGVDTLPPAGIDEGNPGTGQTWDLSGVFVTYVDTIDLLDPATTPNGASFPTSNLCQRTNRLGNESFFYLKSDTAALHAVGIVMDPFQSGTPFVVNIVPPSLVTLYPYQMGVSYKDTSYGDVTTDAGFLGIPLVDSVRYKSTSQRDVLVDGEGTLILGSGTYRVLRERTYTTTIDSIWAHTLFPAGWSFFQETNVKDSSFSFVNDSLGYAIAEVNYDSNGIEYIRYLGPNPPNGVAGDVQRGSLHAYPNPVKDFLKLEDSRGLTQEYRLFTAEGKQVIKAGAVSAKNGLDLSTLPAGMYFVKGYARNGNATGVLRVIHE